VITTFLFIIKSSLESLLFNESVVELNRFLLDSLKESNKALFEFFIVDYDRLQSLLAIISLSKLTEASFPLMTGAISSLAIL